MSYQRDSDSTLIVRFFAKIAIVIGLPSSVWTIYLLIWYPINVQTAQLRIAVMLTLAVGGLLLHVLYPRRQPHPDSTLSRIDGIMLFLSIPALVVLLFVLAFSGLLFQFPTVDSAKFATVTARIDSMELQHIDAEAVKANTQWREVFYLPEGYIDLWVARGQVTTYEVEGKATEPMVGQGMFTLPKWKSVRRSPNYIEHYKMDATMDSERFVVGNSYPGWVLRENQSEVYFFLPAHKHMREALTLFALAGAISLYLIVRIPLGIKFQDRHWRDLRDILTNANSSNSSKRRN